MRAAPLSPACTIPWLAGRPSSAVVPAKQPATIVVLGGGPAGMEAARLAAARGHHVVLFEKEQVLGGKVISGAKVGGHGEYTNVSTYLEREVRRSNDIVLRMGEAASVETVASLAPKTVVVATGATPSRPRLKVTARYRLPYRLKRCRLSCRASM